MSGWKSSPRSQAARRRSGRAGSDLPAMLLRVVDGALASLIFVAPLVLGGRHDVGRLAFAAFASVAGVAWFARQALLGLPSRPPKSALLFIAAAALVLLLQVTPLPATWIAWLTPRTAAVLPLWAGGDLPGTLGAWSTISVEPESTRLCLAMFAAYALAFVTVHERVATREDAAQLVLWVGLSAGMMAVVGIVQLAVPNGKFLWIYEHPTREAVRLSAAFANRNHFAHFVALGAPALAGWLALRAWGVSRGPTPAAADRWAPRGGRVLRATPPAAVAAGAWGVRGWLQGRRGSIGAWGVAALLGVCCAAVVLSCSRGGAAALAVSGGVMATALARSGLLRGSRLAGAAAGGVILFLAVSFTGYDQVVDRLGTLTAQSLDEVDAGSGRRRIWQANLAAIADGGWWGAGAGAHESIYPLYINELPDHHYTHAESSYLQIVTENGVPGALLAAAGLALAVRACWRALRRASTAEGLALAGACTAALAASAAHALFDFVWYIPACVGSMLVLWACAWRLGGLPEAVSAASPVRVAPAAVRSRTALPWAAAGSLCAAYAVVQLLPPAAAAPHWDAYLRMADAHRDHAARSLAAAPASAAEIADRQAADAATFEAMIHALQRVTARRPAFAAAHRMLANRCVQLFNLRMDQSDNRFPLSQVRDCAMQQNFASAGALRAWLTRAVSGHERLLYEAWSHAQQAAALAPLEGDSYVRLGELCFLAGADFATADAYLQQATLARPYDGNLLFEVGRQWGGRGLDEWASTCWVRAFHFAGPHRMHILNAVAGRMPAATLLELFKPQWDTLPGLWPSYRAAAHEERNALLAYARQQAESEAADARPDKALFIWHALAQMQRDADASEAAIASLIRACQAAPTDYSSRLWLGLELLEAGRLADAEAQLRWCHDRRPGDRKVAEALATIARGRLAAADGAVPR